MKKLLIILILFFSKNLFADLISCEMFLKEVDLSYAVAHNETIKMDGKFQHDEFKFEGKYISIKQNKNPKELFEKLKHKIKNKYNLESAEMIMKLLIHKDAVFLDKKGNLISDFDITNIKSSYERERYPKLIKFLETENLDELFSFKE